MKTWTIIQSHMVSIPEFLLGNTYEDVEQHMQEVADSKKVKTGKPPIGDLTFKHFYDGPCREVHGFFVGQDGKKRRFMKVRETTPTLPGVRFLGIVMAWQHFAGKPLRALDAHEVLTLQELDSLELMLKKMSASLVQHDPQGEYGELHSLGVEINRHLENSAAH